MSLRNMKLKTKPVHSQPLNGKIGKVNFEWIDDLADSWMNGWIIAFSSHSRLGYDIHKSIVLFVYCLCVNNSDYIRINHSKCVSPFLQRRCISFYAHVAPEFLEPLLLLYQFCGLTAFPQRVVAELMRPWATNAPQKIPKNYVVWLLEFLESYLL